MADFLDINLKATSPEGPMEYLRNLKDNPNHQELVAKIRKELILRAMKDSGLSQRQVVKSLTQSRDKRIWKTISEEWAGALGMTEAEFLRIAGGKASRR